MKKGCVEITKEGFVNIMEQVKNQNDHDINYCDKLGEALHPHIEMYNNSFLLKALLGLLCSAFEDDNGWIEYFCWELDFGKKYKEGMVTQLNGSNVDLGSAENLYEFLISK